MKDLPSGVSSPSHMRISEQAGNVPKDARTVTDPHHRKLHPMWGKPLPLTKNISLPPNFHPEVEKKLGGIMNSRNSDN